MAGRDDEYDNEYATPAHLASIHADQAMEHEQIRLLQKRSAVVEHTLDHLQEEIAQLKRDHASLKAELKRMESEKRTP